MQIYCLCLMEGLIVEFFVQFVLEYCRCLLKIDFLLIDKEMVQISLFDLGYVGELVKYFNFEFVCGCFVVKIYD